MDITKYRKATPVVNDIDEHAKLKDKVMVCKPTIPSEQQSLEKFAQKLSEFRATTRVKVLGAMFDAAEAYCDEKHKELMAKLESI